MCIVGDVQMTNKNHSRKRPSPVANTFFGNGFMITVTNKEALSDH